MSALGAQGIALSADSAFFFFSLIPGPDAGNQRGVSRPAGRDQPARLDRAGPWARTHFWPERYARRAIFAASLAFLAF